jgi:hypothetical protein
MVWEGGHGDAGGGVEAVTSHLLINDLDDVIRTSRLTRRLMTLITSSWSLTFDSSDVTNAINRRSHMKGDYPPPGNSTSGRVNMDDVTKVIH